jgi:hypothetical protein
MIVTYLDSSALVRLCVGEGDLSDVEKAMAGLPITSVLAGVEVPVAIEARFHRGRISADGRPSRPPGADSFGPSTPSTSAPRWSSIGISSGAVERSASARLTCDRERRQPRTSATTE